MELTFDMIGSPAYGTAFRSYIAKIPLAKLAKEADALPLFVIEKGATIVATKMVVDEVANSNADIAVDVGTYTIIDGAVGAAVDADLLYTATAVKGTDAAKTLYTKTATAVGTQTSADVVVQVVAKAVTVAATKGTLYLEVVTLP